jgi:type 1 glutamine amidotransferase
MKRRQMLLNTGAAAVGLSLLPLGWTLAEDRPRRRVLMFTKSAGFQHGVIARKDDKPAHAEKVFTLAARQQGIDIEATKDGTVFDSDLDQYDAFLFYTTGDLTREGTDKQPPMSAEGKKRFLDAISAGKGFFGSHCASDTFHTPKDAKEPDPYIAMLGGEFAGHGRQQKSTMKLVSPEFPGMKDVARSFEIHEEWYVFRNLAQDMQVILVQETEGMEGPLYDRAPYPATWIRQQDQGRVFYTSMGHREDVWTDPVFQEIALAGLQWAVGNVEAKVKPNLKEVAPQATG